MNILYCSKCGSKNLYEINPPNFCCKCGEPLGLSQANVGSVKKPRAAVTADVDDPDGEDVFFVPNISKLEYSIDGNYENEIVNFGDIVQQESANQKEGKGPPQKVRRRVVEKPRTRDGGKADVDPIKQSMQDCAPAKRDVEGEVSD